MRERWDPLFTFQHSGQTKAEQLENNTTTGLLKILQDSNPAVLEDFFSLFGEGIELHQSVHDAYDGTDQAPDPQTLVARPPDDPVTVHTQRALGSLETGTDTGYVLGISRGSDSIEGEPDEKERDIPDGVIEAPLRGGAAVIAIEVKTGDDWLTEEELTRYAEALEVAEVERAELTWRQVYDFCLDHVGRSSLSNLDRYLLAEYARYLEHEQLETEIGRHTPESGHGKYLHLKRLNGDSSVFEDGKLGVRLRWIDANSNQTSTFGWMSADYFETLLETIPAEVRRATFGGERVEYDPLVRWVYERYPALETKDEDHVFVPERDADLFDELQGTTRHLQFRWSKDNDGGYHHDRPNLRLYREGASCPDLAPDAFESLFSSIDQDIRERMFCAETLDIEAGWRMTLRR